MAKATVYMLQHGNSKPIVQEFDNVTEYQFQNIMAGVLILGNENGTFNDKAFGYFDGVWYHAVPDFTGDIDG